MTGSLTATCTTRAPIAIQATAKWVERKLNSHGYHWAEFISPVVSWKMAAATSTAIESRSRPARSSWRAPRPSEANSRG